VTAFPRQIAPADDERALRIVWMDGHESKIPFVDLRRACPCATCNHEKEERATRLAPAPATAPRSSGLRMVSGPAVGDLALDRIAGVGRYAIQLFWRDGHDTGIFSFDLLRSLCACDACRQRAQKTTPGQGPGASSDPS
jgi:DUF971 family protein